MCKLLLIGNLLLPYKVTSYRTTFQDYYRELGVPPTQVILEGSIANQLTEQKQGDWI